MQIKRIIGFKQNHNIKALKKEHHQNNLFTIQKLINKGNRALQEKVHLIQCSPLLRAAS